ncbi:hypothetical protein ACLZX5_08450 [Enterococcus faecium]
MTKNLLDDFGKIDQTKPKAWTWGEYLFVNHGLTGIRGEAKEVILVFLTEDYLIIKHIKDRNKRR